MFQKRKVQFKAGMSGAANGRQPLRSALTAPPAPSHAPTRKRTLILSVCSRPFTRRSHRLDTALKLQHPSIRSTRSTFQQRTGASFRADRPFRIKQHSDIEKDSEYTSTFVRKKRPLHAAFASARHCAETSASFNQKHAINFPTKSRRFVPRRPLLPHQATPRYGKGLRIYLGVCL